MQISLAGIVLFGAALVLSDIVRTLYMQRPSIKMWRGDPNTYLEVHVLIKASTHRQAQALENDFIDFLRLHPLLDKTPFTIVKPHPSKKTTFIRINMKSPTLDSDQQDDLWRAVTEYARRRRAPIRGFFRFLSHIPKVRAENK